MAASSKLSGRTPTTTRPEWGEPAAVPPGLGQVGERDRAQRRGERAVGDLADEEVHRGRPDEPGHEQVLRGARRARPGVPSCWMTPSRITASRSPRVIASVWSWVTYTVVVCSRRWMRVISDAHLDAQLGVEVGEGLVHEEGLGVANDGAAHRHPLALAAGEVAGLALELVGDAQQVRGVLRPCGGSPRRGPWRGAARSPCSWRPSCADRARSSERPSRCRDPWA